MRERMNEKQTTKTREVTSLKVNPDLWREAKIQAIREGITLGELLDEGLEARLADAAKVKALAAKYRETKSND